MQCLFIIIIIRFGLKRVVKNSVSGNVSKPRDLENKRQLRSDLYGSVSEP